MKRLLHIVATPRSEKSNTLAISQKFIDELRERHPDLEMDEIDLFDLDLPSVTGTNIDTKYSIMQGNGVEEKGRPAWSQIEQHIGQFLASDYYLVTTPMWNFTIPYVLKYYIDTIVQPGYLFKYNEQGIPVPLTQGKRMMIVTTTGGDYSSGTPLAAYDFIEPYLRTIFGFVGIYQIDFIKAGPMDAGPDLRDQAIRQATNLAASKSVEFIA